VEDSNRKLDESLKRTLESTGVISVQMWAVKNLKRKGNSRKTVTRELEALGTLPSKALLESGLSHSGRYVIHPFFFFLYARPND
jgi:hypothetical protein